MDRRLYYLKEGHVVKMPKHNYEHEADLQKLISENPILVARTLDDIDNNQIVLISREQKSQVTEDEGNSFSLDLLLVDRDCVRIPGYVEKWLPKCWITPAVLLLGPLMS